MSTPAHDHTAIHADLGRLRSERAEVVRILSNIPAEQVIDRGSMEYRLEVLQENIAVLERQLNHMR